MNQAPDFNRLAGLYRWMELFSFGPWLWLTRTAFIPELSGAHRALVLGDGDGRFTARLLYANPGVHVDAVDASAAMLEALMLRAGDDGKRVKAHLADIREWQIPADGNLPYDLIATHFFLDCLTTEEVRTLAARLRAAVSPGALWVVSEFAVPSTLFGRWIARPVVSGLYLSFGWLTGLAVRTLPDHASAVRDAGFMLVERRLRLGGLLVSELWCAGVPDSPVSPT